MQGETENGQQGGTEDVAVFIHGDCSVLLILCAYWYYIGCVCESYMWVISTKEKCLGRGS